MNNSGIKRETVSAQRQNATSVQGVLHNDPVSLSANNNGGDWRNGRVDPPVGGVLPDRPVTPDVPIDPVKVDPVSRTGGVVSRTIQRTARVEPIRKPVTKIVQEPGRNRDPLRDKTNTRDPRRDRTPPEVAKPKLTPEVKKVEKPDDRRPHCKSRPERNELRGSGGGGAKVKDFVPWCDKKS